MNTNMSLQQREWVRSFSVDLAPASAGPTHYRLTSVLHPAGFPEAASCLVVNRRFSQIRKLHQALSQLHRQLHLRGTFPSLPKETFFSRFDPTVMEERRLASLRTLEAAALHPPLYNSQVLTAFFTAEDGDEDAASTASSDAAEAVHSTPPASLSPIPPPLVAAAASSAVESVSTLAEKGNVMDAAALATQLAPDDTPALTPQTLDIEPPLRQTQTQTQTQTTPASRTPTSPEEEMKNLPEYLSDAANDLSQALQFESEEKFDESIASYRNAIGTLLSSVQQDRCLKRQASVKRRIKQYIGKAEDLAERQRQRQRQPQDGQPVFKTRSSQRLPHLDLFGDMENLKRYQFLDVLAGKVLLVSDFRSEAKLVIKVVQKSSIVFRKSKRSILPTNVANMVPLICYYESDDALFLVLEYMPNGNLYDAVKVIFGGQQQPSEDHVDGGEKNKTDESGTSQEMATPLARTASPSVSVIKPSTSFLQIRNSAAADVDVACGSVSTDDSSGVGDDSSPHTREGSVEKDIDFVHKVASDAVDGGTENLVCINQDGIEKISLEDSVFEQAEEKGTDASDDDEPFDFVNDFADEEAEEAFEHHSSQVSAKPAYHSPSQLILDAQQLLSSIDSTLQKKQGSEQLLTRLERIEKRIQLHMSGQSISNCGSPFRQVPSRFSRPVSALRVASPDLSIGGMDVDGDEDGREKAKETEGRKEDGDPYRYLALPIFQEAELSSLPTGRSNPIPLSVLRTWAVELCQALFGLHTRDILVKDLNPRHLLLDASGHLRLAFHCEWVSVDRGVDPYAQQCLYTAPELLDVRPLTPACDWWSAGVLLYELATGAFFVDVHPSGLRSHTPVALPEDLDAELADLLSRLLRPLPVDRLGAGSDGADDVRKHRFFNGVEWD